MSNLQTLLRNIPEGGQYQLIRDALVRVDRTFPEDLPQVDDARVQGWVNDVNTGVRDAKRIRNDIFKYIVGEEMIMERLGVDAAKAQRLINMEDQFAQFQPLVGAGDIGSGKRPEIESAPLTILQSPSLKWYMDPQSHQYYASYKLPNSNREYIFEAEPDQISALFGTRPPPAESITLKQLTGRENVTFGGNISEMEGRGSFDTDFSRIKATALDNGVLPEWMRNDAAAMDLLALAHLEGKSTDWALEKIAALPSFARRFPGIQGFKEHGMTTAESVQAFLQFEAGLKTLEKQQGRDGSRITPDIVGALATKGYSFEQVEQTYTVFKRLDDYAPAMAAFNEVLLANGMQPLTSTQDKFNFLAGAAPQEIYDVYEASSFREAAVKAGLGDAFSAHAAVDAALQTPGMLSQERVTQGMQAAAAMVLRMRYEVDTQAFGLSTDDLIDASMGLAPRSGNTEADIMQSIDRAVSAGRAYTEGQRAKPFTGFTSTGTPQAASLANARQTR